MEKSLEDTIIEKYLSKILMEYYDGTLSKEDMKKLTKFDSINCKLTDQKSQTGESLQLSCETKPNN